MFVKEDPYSGWIEEGTARESLKKKVGEFSA